MIPLLSLYLLTLQTGSFGVESISEFTPLSTVDQHLQFLEDLDGDGIPDFLLSNLSSSNGGLIENGQIEIHSGSTGVVLGTIYGQGDYSRLGVAILPMDDLDGDGVFDFLAANGIGFITAFSGNTFLPIYQSQVLWGPFFSRVPVLVNLGDVDGDLISDFSFSDDRVEPSVGTDGAIAVFSGANGSLVWEREGVPFANQGLGNAATSIDDIDADGIHDIVASSKADVACYSGSSGALIWTAPNPGILPVQSSLINLNDVNGDGVSDIAYGDRYSNQVHVLSGLDGSSLYTVDPLSRDFRLGLSLLPLQDLDNDGINDFLIGSPESRFEGRLTGWIYLASGVDGKRIGSFPGRVGFLYSGADGWLLNAKDWNGDGVDEWATLFSGGPTQPTSIVAIQRFVPPLSLQISGSCPGPVSMDISGGTPNGFFGLAVGLGGQYQLPDGPAEELELGTGTPLFRSVRQFSSNGSAMISPMLPAALCGLKIQAFDIATRSVSSALTL